MLKKIFTVLVYIFAAVGFFLVAGYLLVRFGFTNQSGIIDRQRDAFLGASAGMFGNTFDRTAPWSDTEEWGVLEAAIRRDESAITRAAHDAGVPPRLIVANLVAEQLRLFFTDREDYKQFFYPLKILGAQTQFSWGVMGMKEETAVPVENNLKDPRSPFYPGDQFAHLLDFPATTTNYSAARFTRMTDQHDHYWSYLYAGLYMKEVETQWKNAGFPITNNVAVISTLYNIGFTHSEPKPNPQVGGAEIDIDGTAYSFGGIADDFYQSDLLTDVFPR
jgi:hypothetical protein